MVLLVSNYWFGLGFKLLYLVELVIIIMLFNQGVHIAKGVIRQGPAKKKTD